MEEVEPFFKGRTAAEVALWAGLTGCLLFALVSVSVVETFLGLALAAWVILLVQRRRRVEAPGFIWPFLVYAAWSLLSSVMSKDPATSFIECRKLLLILVVPVTLAAFFSARAFALSVKALAASALAASAWALVRFLVHHAPGERARGFMGHYMTQAGLLMIFGAAALALALYLRDRTRWLWGLAFALSLPALGLTLTRSAWIGLILAAVFIIGLYRPKALVLVPVLVGLFFLVGTRDMRRRALSVFSSYGYSNQERLEYARAGLKIIGDYPVFGTGPHTVSMVFQDPRYGLGEQAKRNVHLHSNPVQIAAERGLPALAAWLAFLVWAFIELFRMFRSSEGPGRAWAAAGLAAVVALFVGGFFEYNFGDSEVATLFYFLIALPFARQALDRRAARGGGGAR